MAIALRRHAFILLSFIAAAASSAAWAQTEAAAGRFLSVTGEVNVLGRDGASRTTERGSEFRAGETVVTGDNGLAQLRMTDGSLLSVRGGSEFKLEQFAYAGKDDSNAAFVMSVLKGGFRTITGLIAQANRRGYRINTPSATIGVRGTHFEVVHVLPQLASTEAPAGTYNRVYEGITTLQVPAGVQLQVAREQTAFAGLQGATPVLVAPPAAVFGRPTPIPRAAVPAPQAPTRAAAPSPNARAGLPTAREAVPTLRTPLEPTTTLRTLEPATTTLAPTTTVLQSPTTTIRTLEPTKTLISPTTTILQAPVLQSPTTTIVPIAPATPTAPATILQTPPTTILKQSINVVPVLTR